MNQTHQQQRTWKCTCFDSRHERNKSKEHVACRFKKNPVREGAQVPALMGTLWKKGSVFCSPKPSVNFSFKEQSVPHSPAPYNLQQGEISTMGSLRSPQEKFHIPWKTSSPMKNNESRVLSAIGRVTVFLFFPAQRLETWAKWRTELRPLSYGFRHEAWQYWHSSWRCGGKPGASCSLGCLSQCLASLSSELQFWLVLLLKLQRTEHGQYALNHLLGAASAI